MLVNAGKCSVIFTGVSHLVHMLLSIGPTQLQIMDHGLRGVSHHRVSIGLDGHTYMSIF